MVDMGDDGEIADILNGDGRHGREITPGAGGDKRIARRTGLSARFLACHRAGHAPAFRPDHPDQYRRPPARRPCRPQPARAHGIPVAGGLCAGLGGLRHDRQIEPGPAFRHGRGDRLVARSVLGLPQTPAAGGRAGLGLVCGLSGHRVHLLPAGDADAGAGAVVRLAAVGGLSRHRKAHRRAGAADAGAVFQFPRAQVQCEHRADAGLGDDHVLVFALGPHPQRVLRRAGRFRRRFMYARQILVDLSAGRADRGGAARQAPRRLFQVTGALDLGGGRTRGDGTASAIGCGRTTSHRSPMRSPFMATNRSAAPSLPRSAISWARSATSRCRSFWCWRRRGRTAPSLPV